MGVELGHGLVLPGEVEERGRSRSRRLPRGAMGMVPSTVPEAVARTIAVAGGGEDTAVAGSAGVRRCHRSSCRRQRLLRSSSEAADGAGQSMSSA